MENYKSPESEIIEISTEGVLCQSNLNGESQYYTQREFEM